MIKLHAFVSSTASFGLLYVDSFLSLRIYSAPTPRSRTELGAMLVLEAHTVRGGWRQMQS